MADGRRMRSMSVAIGVTAVAAAALSGCTSTPDYEAVCIDEQTYERVDDDMCDDDENNSYGSGYRWYYYGGGTRVPSVGSHVSGGSTSKPRGSTSGSGYGSGSGSGDSYSDTGSSSHDYGGFGGRSGGVSS